MPTPYPASILMTADTVGGVWTYALELVRALAPFGTRVALATMGAPLAAHQWEQAEALPNLTIYESSYRLEWMNEPWDDVAAAGEWLLQLEAQVQPDLVHLNGLVHSALPWQRPVLAVVHSCVLSWWQAVKGEDAPEIWATYRRLVRQGLQAADAVVAPTGAMLRAAQELYGPFQQSAVIHNGASPQAFRPVTKEPFIFGMGRVWDEAKNLALLAQAAAGLPWPVYLAGDARHPATGQVLELPNVHFLGQLPASEVKHWLARASIYALPARYEPFGLSFLEAALAGCALVAGDIASLREVWGAAACYVPPQDAAALHNTLFSLIEGESVRLNAAARAQTRALQYTLARQVEEYGRLYQQLALVPSTTGLASTTSP